MNELEVVNEILIGISFLWVGGAIANFTLTSNMLRGYMRKLFNAGNNKLIGKAVAILGIIFLSFIICGSAHIATVAANSHPNSASIATLRRAILMICCVISIMAAAILTVFLPRIRAMTDKLELTEEGKLEEVENQFLEVIEACHESILVLDNDLNIIGGNGPTAHFFGDDFKKRHLLSFIHHEDQESLRRASKMQTGHDIEQPSLKRGKLSRVKCESSHIEVEGVHSIVEYRLRSPPIQEPGAESTWVWMEAKLVCRTSGRVMMLSRNVDAVKEKEIVFIEKQRELAHENAMKLKYITCTAHDLKTPLQSFIFALDLLGQVGPLTTEQLDVLMQARVSYSLMTLTISQTMDSSKVLMGGKLQPHKNTLKLSDVICKVALIIDSYSRSVPIVFKINCNLCNHIISDEEWLWQTMLNMLTNACKFTSVGSIEVHVYITSHSVALENENKLGCGGSMLMIEVIDTGIGVNGKVGSELFNVFSQAQRGQISGTGLGLFGIR